tara:strand:+ start:653 stop:1261 length:609 start_codon:yes stop_codon:yes gene_type:complete
MDTLTYRPMILADLDTVPVGCHGARDAIVKRIGDLGAAAILAFDGEKHVAQLQFRRYQRTLRSPDGLWDPLYWGDFGLHAPSLPYDTLSVFCYHVGQLEDSEARDASYQGRGIGLALLDYFLQWASDGGYSAAIAKCTPSARSIMSFMGGQPSEAYVERGFALTESWVDSQLRDVIQEKKLVPEGVDLDDAARVGCCVKLFD